MNAFKETPDGIEITVSVVPAEDFLVMLQNGKTFRPGMTIPISECPHTRGHRTPNNALKCAIRVLRAGS